MIDPLKVEAACEVMHDAYEQAAVGAGWSTNLASRKPWAQVPEANKETMRAAVTALLEWTAAQDAMRLSKLMFEARELIEMFSDVIEASSEKTDEWGRRVVTEIDDYRAEQGWSPYGFGGEATTKEAETDEHSGRDSGGLPVPEVQGEEG